MFSNSDKMGYIDMRKFVEENLEETSRELKMLDLFELCFRTQEIQSKRIDLVSDHLDILSKRIDNLEKKNGS